ncbi:methyltransferase domain-containing protein [Devosia sp.]|uniref:methyltransferase domain-containing protein n=1 Tax=Devosia sp. TaxID=1871048 RepID=UPI003A8DE92F
MSLTLETQDPVASSSTARSLRRRLLAFLAVGGTATLLYVILTSAVIGLKTGVPDWLLGAVCYALFIVPTYLAQRRLSFRSDARHQVAFPRYAAVQAVSLVLVAVLSFVFYSILGIAPPLGALIVAGLAAGASFVLLQFWAFSSAPRGGAGGKQLLNSVHDAAVFQRRVEVLSSHLAAAIPSGGRVLDLGSGDGSIAASLMRQRPDLAVEGVDVMLRPVTQIPVTLYDGNKLPFADDSFDHVTIVDVLHHTDDPAAVLAEAARVARVSVVIKDHLMRGPVSHATLRFMDWVGNRGHDVVLPYNYLSETRWQAAFDHAGLKQEARVEKLGIYPVPFTFIFDGRLHFVATLRPNAR